MPTYWLALSILASCCTTCSFGRVLPSRGSRCLLQSLCDLPPSPPYPSSSSLSLTCLEAAKNKCTYFRALSWIAVIFDLIIACDIYYKIQTCISYVEHLENSKNIQHLEKCARLVQYPYSLLQFLETPWGRLGHGAYIWCAIGKEWQLIDQLAALP